MIKLTITKSGTDYTLVSTDLCLQDAYSSIGAAAHTAGYSAHDISVVKDTLMRVNCTIVVDLGETTYTFSPVEV